MVMRTFKTVIKKTLESFEGKTLTDIDQKLLRGLNEKDIGDLEERKDRMFNGLKKYFLAKVEEERKKSNILLAL